MEADRRTGERVATRSGGPPDPDLVLRFDDVAIGDAMGTAYSPMFRLRQDYSRGCEQLSSTLCSVRLSPTT